MFAIIETGGKQIKVSEGETVKIEKTGKDQGDAITLERVLMISRDDRLTFGTPYIEGAQVKAEVVSNGKEKKVLVFKMKPRKGFRRLRGHRQSFTLLRINEIIGG